MITASALRSIENFIIDSLLNTNNSKALITVNTGLFIFCGILICIGLAFITYATYMSLLSQYSTPFAASITGVMCIAFALAAYCVFYALKKYQHKQIQKTRLKLIEKAKVFLASLDEELGEPIRNYPKISVVIAALTGFLLEEKIF
jgi:hypothetical protein